MSDQPGTSTSNQNSSNNRRTASVNSVNTNARFNCANCKNPSLIVGKPVYYLPCLHVFCYSCYENKLSQLHNSGLVCPTCGKESTKESVFDDFTYDPLRKGCEMPNCTHKSMDEVFAKCDTCKKFLCESCSLQHDRSHKFLDASAYIPMNSRCSGAHKVHKFANAICGCGKKLCVHCTINHRCNYKITNMSHFIQQSVGFMNSIAENDKKIYAQYQKNLESIQNRRREIMSEFFNCRSFLAYSVAKYTSLVIKRFEHIADHLDLFQQRVLEQLARHETMIAFEMQRYGEVVGLENQISTTKEENAIPFFSFIKAASTYAAEKCLQKNYNVDTLMPMVNVRVDAKMSEFCSFLANFGVVHVNGHKSNPQSNFESTKSLFDVVPKLNSSDVAKPTGFMLRSLSGDQYNAIDMEQIRRTIKQVQDPDELRDRCTQLEAEVNYYKRLTLELENELKQRRSESTSQKLTPSASTTNVSNVASNRNEMLNRNLRASLQNHPNIFRQTSLSTSMPSIHQNRRAQMRPPVSYPEAAFVAHQMSLNNNSIVTQTPSISPFSITPQHQVRMLNSPLINPIDRIPVAQSPLQHSPRVISPSLSQQQYQQLFQLPPTHRMPPAMPNRTSSSVVNVQQANNVPVVTTNTISQRASSAQSTVSTQSSVQAPTPKNAESLLPTPIVDAYKKATQVEIITIDEDDIHTPNLQNNRATTLDSTNNQASQASSVVSDSSATKTTEVEKPNAQSTETQDLTSQRFSNSHVNVLENTTEKTNGTKEGTNETEETNKSADGLKDAIRSSSVPQLPANNSNGTTSQQNSPAASISLSKKHKRHRTYEHQQPSSSKSTSGVHYVSATSSSPLKLRIRLENNENKPRVLPTVVEPEAEPVMADAVPLQNVVLSKSDDEDELTNGRQMSDGWEDYCATCFEGCDVVSGSLGCCATCPKVFHRLCHIPSIDRPMEELPDDWQCGACVPVEPVRETLDHFDNNALLACSKVLLACFNDPHKIEYFRKPENYRSKSENNAPSIDLMTITNRLSNRQYESISTFISDMIALFQNCSKYNQPSSEIANAARYVYSLFHKAVRKYLPGYTKELWMYVNLYKNDSPRKKRRLMAPTDFFLAV
ncbi:hypothetical protein M3Y98_00310400 [Aphelenchoides besseyi]|nr:hypothetical protein M3Y98_00310400 [Aphelenchoides besseyi]KAI6201314.1 hypothetical protein M3Y96_00828500 [Aphelenchoides besseyi]